MHIIITFYAVAQIRLVSSIDGFGFDLRKFEPAPSAKLICEKFKIVSSYMNT
jgi:hypothetical protein